MDKDFVGLVAALASYTTEERLTALRLASLVDERVEANKPVPPLAPPTNRVQKAKPAPAKPQKRRGRKPGSKNKPKAQPSDPVAESFHQVAEKV